MSLLTLLEQAKRNVKKEHWDQAMTDLAGASMKATAQNLHDIRETINNFLVYIKMMVALDKAKLAEAIEKIIKTVRESESE